MLSIMYATLSDKTRVVIRPARPGDAPLIEAMHERLSPRTLYQRYMQYSAPPAAEFEKVCTLPPAAGAVFVATAETPGEQVVGIAYYVLEDLEPQITAEPALLIEDAYQGRGLGKFMFWHLCQYARQQNVAVFEGVVYAANEAMMRVLRRSGFAFTQTFAYGMREIRLSLESDIQRPLSA